ncbi:MAG: type II toxin-antitoxin system PemK/MazF family toxin [Mobilicoccus sp.]|nr:type II toxin-antitoxin system PemK/MazF family toxin [Mobilicoccus sp.]
MTPAQGEVWWAAPNPAVGREQRGRRPVVIISGQDFHEVVTPLVIVLPVTTRDRGWVSHVELLGPHGLDRPSWAMTEQVRAVSRDRLERRTGTVDAQALSEMLRWVTDHLR